MLQAPRETPNCNNTRAREMVRKNHMHGHSFKHMTVDVADGILNVK